MRMKSLLVIPFCALGLAVAGIAPASAAGQVERGPEHANSICSFSGLNDDPDDPVEGGRVQSYGQIVAAGDKAFVPSPSLLCNGHLFPYPEGFEGPE
jgi:poly(3-hydroxybutyrate) depolymerase